MLNTKKWSYGTFNSFRSALSLILPGEIGKDIYIRRFLKSISKTRPSKPNYDVTWEPQIVLNHIEEKFPHDELPLRELGKKLTTLLTLITGHRLQTLSLIKVENIYFEPDGVQILIIDNIKTSRPKSEHPCDPLL
ncbi:hypothetical protein NQ314_002622 [Rhamnusium bicolor]|uniref:Tyr recombinase domain-containing protein n=1 Tax=Rhamnusium bicolor TaxID=1586634 RepID=A0AAV8ZRJ2_9CUCU|nr:hypothetical protein NQ314_002622 [Rhamnusium bicolor]